MASKKIEELKARHAKELAAAETEDSIRQALPPALQEKARVFVHSLYGSIAAITFEGPYAASLNFDFLVDVARALPAVETTLVRDSCLSFQPTAYVEGLPETKKEGWKEETSVSPLRFSIEPVTSVRLEAEWFARLTDGRIVSVKVVFGYPPNSFGTYSAKRVEYRGGFKYESATFRADPALHVAIDNEGEPIAQLESPIRWASGSDQYPNRMTLYFVDLGADFDPATVAIVIAEHVAKLARRTA